MNRGGRGRTRPSGIRQAAVTATNLLGHMAYDGNDDEGEDFVFGDNDRGDDVYRPISKNYEKKRKKLMDDGIDHYFLNP